MNLVMGRKLGWFAAAVASLMSAGALAQETPAVNERVVDESAPMVGLSEGVTLSGYAEAHYGFDFTRPKGGAILLRTFDQRSNTFTVDNAVLDVAWQKGPVQGRIGLQAGSTPSSYYRGELSLRGYGVNADNGGSLWQNIQQAWIGYKVNDSGSVFVQAGIFLSPIGTEVIPVKDNWNWSRSNLFAFLPAYHAGVKVGWQVTETLVLMAKVCNGWNSVLDNNEAKSVMAQALWTTTKVQAGVLYMGGNERTTDAKEGTPWRNLGDAWITAQLGERFWLMAHVDGGMEETKQGTASWFGAALYAKAQLAEKWFVALRGDTLGEQQATDAAGVTSDPILIPVKRISSATLTFDYRPTTFLLIRAEGRGDMTDGLGFIDDKATFSAAGDPIANASKRVTATLGVTAWF
jgi:hypothetical protein